MKLGIDAREIQEGVCTGIGRSLANFLNYFKESVGDDECVLFSGKSLPMDFGPRVRNIVIQEWLTLWWDQAQLPRAIKKEKIDVFYSPYYKLPLSASCRCVCAVLDLMYLEFPPYRRRMNPLARLYYFTFGKAYVRKAEKVLTCSVFSKKDISRIYKIGEDKIEVIPLSVGDIYRPEHDEVRLKAMKERYGIDGPYILYLGNFKAHKNVENIVRAFQRIAPRFAQIKLVLAGPQTHEFDTIRSLVRELSLQHRVIATGKITDEDELRFLYGGAECALMPSFYEGFGLPALEAMACGTPVVASTVTSVPEVVGNAGLLADPHNVNDMAAAIGRILDNETLRKELSVRGLAKAREYDERRIAKLNYEFFKRTAGRHV